MRTGGPRESQDRCESRSVLQALTSSPLKEVGVRCFWELVDSRMWVKQRWGGRWWKFEKEGKLRDGVIGVGAGGGSIGPASIGVFAPQRGWRALLLGADRRKTDDEAEAEVGRSKEGA